MFIFRKKAVLILLKPYLLTTILVTAALIVFGRVTERMFKKPAGAIMRQLLENPGAGRIRFLGRVGSNLLLNLLGLGVYVLITFLLCALLYSETDPGYLLVSSVLLATYYAKFFILAAGSATSITVTLLYKV